MYLMFIDESGTPPPPNKIGTNFFILGATIISEQVWHHIAGDFRSLKEKYSISGEIKWRFFSPNNQKQENSLIHLEQSKRFALRDDLFSLLTKYRSVKLLGTAANVEQYYQRPSVNSADDIYHLAYKQLIERFQYFLQDTSRESGIDASGIVICDHRGSRDDMRLRHLHESLLKTRNGFQSTFSRLIEGVFIAPSHMTIGIQLADMVAGAIFRWFESDDARSYKKIEKNFRKNPRNGAVWGYGIVTDKDDRK